MQKRNLKTEFKKSIFFLDFIKDLNKAFTKTKTELNQIFGRSFLREKVLSEKTNQIFSCESINNKLLLSKVKRGFPIWHFAQKGRFYFQG